MHLELDCQRGLAQIGLQAVFSKGTGESEEPLFPRWRIHPSSPEHEMTKGAQHGPPPPRFCETEQRLAGLAERDVERSGAG